jgi:hypothetical protein
LFTGRPEDYLGRRRKRIHARRGDTGVIDGRAPCSTCGAGFTAERSLATVRRRGGALVVFSPLYLPLQYKQRRQNKRGAVGGVFFCCILLPLSRLYGGAPAVSLVTVVAPAFFLGSLSKSPATHSLKPSSCAQKNFGALALPFFPLSVSLPAQSRCQA